MRCIFCKLTSDSSKSVEHIIPESLGNKSHILPKGVVCDDCNNYFARKIEGPLLSGPFFAQTRGLEQVPNKRGRTLPILAIHKESQVPVKLHFTESGAHLWADNQNDEKHFIKSLLSHQNGTLLTGINGFLDKKAMSRLLLKVGIEFMAQRVMKVSGWNEWLVNEEQLDDARNYVRRGSKYNYWPFHQRRIYQTVFGDPSDVRSDILHEYDILQTEQNEWYIVVCIFGVEYAINLGGPEIDGYINWLKFHNGRSPLY